MTRHYRTLAVVGAMVLWSVSAFAATITPIGDFGGRPHPAEHQRYGSPGQYWQPFPPGPCDTIPRRYWEHVQRRYNGSYPRPNYYYAPHPNQVCADRWWRLWRS